MEGNEIVKARFNKAAVAALVMALVSTVVYYLYLKYRMQDRVAIISIVVFATAVLLDIFAFIQIILKKQKGMILILLSLIIPMAFLLYIFIGFANA